MAYEVPPYAVIGTLKVPNSTAWAGYQFRAVSADSTEGYCRLPNSSLGKKTLGILQNKPAALGAATIWPIGSGAVSKVISRSTNVHRGDLVWFSSLGLAQPSSSVKASGDIGIPLYGPVLSAHGTTQLLPITLVLQLVDYSTQ